MQEQKVKCTSFFDQYYSSCWCLNGVYVVDEQSQTERDVHNSRKELDFVAEVIDEKILVNFGCMVTINQMILLRLCITKAMIQKTSIFQKSIILVSDDTQKSKNKEVVGKYCWRQLMKT